MKLSASCNFWVGTDTFWDLRADGTGDLMIALGASFPSPDPGMVHIWKGSAGAVAADTALNPILTLENNNHIALQFLTPNGKIAAIVFGDVTDPNTGQFRYNHASNEFQFIMNGAQRLQYGVGSFEFQEGTIIKTIAGNLNIAPAGIIVFEGISTVEGASGTLGVGATTVGITTTFITLTGDGGGNTLATITGASIGQELRILFTDANITITDTDAHTADTIDLNAAFTSADDTVLVLFYDGVSWYEISRSVN